MWRGIKISNKISNMLVGYCRLIFHISMLVGFGYVYTYTPFNVFLYPHLYLGITKTIQKNIYPHFCHQVSVHDIVFKAPIVRGEASGETNKRSLVFFLGAVKDMTPEESRRFDGRGFSKGLKSAKKEGQILTIDIMYC